MKKTFVVLCPGRKTTGGPEALHQLVNELNQVPGVEGLMYYVGGLGPGVVEEYWDAYDIRVTERLDVPGAAYVLPEVYDPASMPPVPGRKWCWWLSARRFFPLAAYAGFHHLFQSAYARERLGALGLDGMMLTDYLRETFGATGTRPKEDLVAYNGTKSALAMMRLRLAHPGLRCVALLGMSHDAVRDTLARAKVYVDFGAHPGCDRLPREAALLGCVVITNREGAAAYDEDVPLPAGLKLEKWDADSLAKAVVHAFEHHAALVQALAPYRAWIAAAPARFAAEVRAFVQAEPAAPAPPDPERAARTLAALDRDWLATHAALESRTRFANEFANEVEAAWPGATRGAGS